MYVCMYVCMLYVCMYVHQNLCGCLYTSNHVVTWHLLTNDIAVFTLVQDGMTALKAAAQSGSTAIVTLLLKVVTNVSGGDTKYAQGMTNVLGIKLQRHPGGMANFIAVNIPWGVKMALCFVLTCIAHALCVAGSGGCQRHQNGQEPEHGAASSVHE